MKYIFFTKQQLIFAICALTALATSCINEDLSECKYYNLKMKVLNGKGDEITEAGDRVFNATLFIFDENEKYIGQKAIDGESIKNKKEIALGEYPENTKLHIVAWGNFSTKNQEAPNLSDKTSLSEFKIELKRKTEGIAQSPDSLYYGYETVDLSKGLLTKDYEIAIRPKISRVIITTEGVNNFNNYTKAESSDLAYYLRRTPSAFDYAGEMTGDSISYNPDAAFTQEGNYVAPTSTMLPSQYLTLDLYQNDKILDRKSVV